MFFLNLFNKKSASIAKLLDIAKLPDIDMNFTLGQYATIADFLSAEKTTRYKFHGSDVELHPGKDQLRVMPNKHYGAFSHQGPFVVHDIADALNYALLRTFGHNQHSARDFLIMNKSIIYEDNPYNGIHNLLNDNRSNKNIPNSVGYIYAVNNNDFNIVSRCEVNYEILKNNGYKFFSTESTVNIRRIQDHKELLKRCTPRTLYSLKENRNILIELREKQK